jgi:hypothetical protein
MPLTADLNADARNLKFNAGLPLLFAPVIAVLFPALSTTICPNLIAVTGFDASLLTNRAYTLLPTHALGAGLLGDERYRGHHKGCDRKTTEQCPHESSFVVYCRLNDPARCGMGVRAASLPYPEQLRSASYGSTQARSFRISLTLHWATTALKLACCRAYMGAQLRRSWLRCDLGLLVAARFRSPARKGGANKAPIRA